MRDRTVSRLAEKTSYHEHVHEGDQAEETPTRTIGHFRHRAIQTLASTVDGSTVKQTKLSCSKSDGRIDRVTGFNFGLRESEGIEVMLFMVESR